jgi:hypothetical protein
MHVVQLDSVPFVSTQSDSTRNQRTFAGSVIIIFRPGFFFGFESASSDPESMAEFADSTMNETL